MLTLGPHSLTAGKKPELFSPPPSFCFDVSDFAPDLFHSICRFPDFLPQCRLISPDSLMSELITLRLYLQFLSSSCNSKCMNELSTVGNVCEIVDVKFRVPAAIINKQLRLDLRLETLSSLEVYVRLTDCLSVCSSTDCSKLAGTGSHRWHHHHHHKQTHTWSWSILVAPQQINSSSSNLSLWASRENSQQQPLTMSTVASANVDGDQWTEVLGISR